ncbi:MAG: hypothetical protein KL840_06820 [Aquamicrobium sp.]|jgi:hypothetical protein|nr:hypothetical protein [Aquamicrobium sp.]
MSSHVRRIPSDLVQPFESMPSLVERLRQEISEARLDCGCKETANDMLDRIDAEEELVRRGSGLADARRMRDAIVIVLALLGELDELMPDEPDGSAFMEIADLFADISGFAAVGAQAARKAAGAGR